MECDITIKNMCFTYHFINKYHSATLDDGMNKVVIFVKKGDNMKKSLYSIECCGCFCMRIILGALATGFIGFVFGTIYLLIF